jgi:5-methyltetrahydrofolate--homocysteine methyltransferase
MTSFLERLQSGQVLVADGATGTNLQQRGLGRGVPADEWVLDRPEEILRLHRDFIAAGANIILTCTFGASSVRLQSEGALAGRAAEVNRRAVALAREAARGTDTLVAASIGPTGQLLKPLGPLDEEEAAVAFAEQAGLLSEAGADLLVVETQYDLAEAKAAMRAAREFGGGLPVVCSFSYDRGTRTMMGVKPAQMAAEMEGLADVLGINCGRSLEDNLKALQELRQATARPIWFKPNAGLPKVDEQGVPSYDVTPEMMGARVPGWIAAGASIVGGCCGASPQHLRAIAQAVR